MFKRNLKVVSAGVTKLAISLSEIEYKTNQAVINLLLRRQAIILSRTEQLSARYQRQIQEIDAMVPPVTVMAMANDELFESAVATS